MYYSINYKMKEPMGSDYYDVEDFNYNTDIIDGLLNELSGGASIQAEEHTITLSTNSWRGNNQTVIVNGVTPTSVIIPGIAMNCPKEQFERLIEAKIIITALAENSITLTAFGAVPNIDCLYSFAIISSYVNDDSTENGENNNNEG